MKSLDFGAEDRLFIDSTQLHNNDSSFGYMPLFFLFKGFLSPYQMRSLAMYVILHQLWSLVVRSEVLNKRRTVRSLGLGLSHVLVP